jgi:hypothetical protein
MPKVFLLNVNTLSVLAPLNETNGKKNIQNKFSLHESDPNEV